MGWCGFLFSLSYRLALAFLAHFNWMNAFYANCVGPIQSTNFFLDLFHTLENLRPVMVLDALLLVRMFSSVEAGKLFAGVVERVSYKEEKVSESVVQRCLQYSIQPEIHQIRTRVETN